jgi:hypothetical protein
MSYMRTILNKHCSKFDRQWPRPHNVYATNVNIPWETETRRVVVEGHEIEVVKPGTAQKVTLKAVFVYIQYTCISSDRIV